MTSISAKWPRPCAAIGQMLLVMFAMVCELGWSAVQAAESAPPSTTSAAMLPTTVATVPAEAKVGDDYIIGPGDTLQVFVWRNPELTVTVPVRPDGKISTPLVEDMVAVGKTPSQLARDVEKVLEEYVRSPQINVIVTQPASVFSQIKVIGQVVRPQSIPYRDGLTVLDAVLAVGGLGPFAAGNRTKIVRTENGKPREIKVKLAALVNNGDMRQNIALKPGDVIVVPESRF
ncbi:MAG TPA: polysaccharide export protein [Povalibacter sp.]|uniref:XrtA/PEP-CTERM system exopolysaccharide export protein n=1 Tax=Povalibacter sp. TaxID=1962978 RepID=UPI002CA20A66|nr:XrtA/PEP-CTERM system exopolysaccharide export protein [Povalibacter sp.]HMN42958.1 polysaccharide export protein [Povalibacter sp.]